MGTRFVVIFLDAESCQDDLVPHYAVGSFADEGLALDYLANARPRDLTQDSDNFWVDRETGKRVAYICTIEAPQA